MRFLTRLVRRWYLYLLLVLVIPTAATIFGINRLSTYQSTAYLFVDQPAFLSNPKASDWNSYLSPAENEVNAMRDLLVSPSFAVDVAKSTDLARRNDLSSRSGQDQVFTIISQSATVSVATGSSKAIYLVVQGKDPYLDQQLASALITNFQTYYRQRSLGLDDQAKSFYSAQLDDANRHLNEDTDKLTSYILAHPSVTSALGEADPEYAQLKQTVQSDGDQVASFKTTLQAIELDRRQVESGARTLKQQDPPSLPLAPQLDTKKLFTLYTGGGLAAALVLVGLIVGALTLLDRRIYSTEDLRDIVESMDMTVAVIETMPVLRAGRRGPGGGGGRSGGRGGPSESPLGLVLPKAGVTAGASRATATLTQGDEAGGDVITREDI